MFAIGLKETNWSCDPKDACGHCGAAERIIPNIVLKGVQNHYDLDRADPELYTRISRQ